MYSGTITPHAPTKLLLSLWTSFRHLAGYEQQDAHEFLVALLYRLHEHLGGRAFGCDCVIHRTFSGVLQSSVTCLGCGTCSPVFDPFMDIALDVHPREMNEQLSLQLCLDRFCAVETLPGGSYVCAACNSTFREAHKQLSIRKPPNTLCFQLKRFGQTIGTPLMNQVQDQDGSSTPSVSSGPSQSSKLHHRVSFPEVFSIYPYLSDSSRVGYGSGDGISNENPYADQHMYKLSAVIHHIGDLDSSGHYVSYLNHHSNWFKCDDATVSVVPASEVYQCTAYMLFYNRLVPIN